MFSTGTIIIPKLNRSNQNVISIPLANIGIVEQVFVVLVEPIYVLHVQITIFHGTFKQHLLKTFFQPKTKDMTIDGMFTIDERIQNYLCIAN